MKAVIPAAGQGTRLYPQTHTKPKPMVRLAGKPILGHILEGFEETPITDIVIVVGVMREHVVEYANSNFGDVFDLEFVEQEETEGLGHCIYQTREVVDDESVCIALGDMLFDAGYGEFLDAHDQLESVDGSIGVKSVQDPSNYGVVSTEKGRVTELVEKPAEPDSSLAISGVYVIEDSAALFAALDYLISNDIRGAGEEFQLTDALQRMVQNGANLGTFEVSDWYDCGRPETLLTANRVLLERRGEEVKSVDEAVLIPPVDIGENVNIERSVVGPYASVDDGATITDSRVREGIIGRSAALSDVNLSETIVGEESTVTGTPMKLNVGDSSEVNF